VNDEMHRLIAQKDACANECDRAFDKMLNHGNAGRGVQEYNKAAKNLEKRAASVDKIIKLGQ
jgi:hypothetical protein